MFRTPGCAMTDLRVWRCPHCDSTNVLRSGLPDPDGRPRQLLDVRHEPGCPDRVDEDEEPAAEYDTARLRGLGYEIDE
jgi:hypothetical protein